MCQSVLNFVTEGTYPDEDVVSAEFPVTALAKELELISEARKQVEVRRHQSSAFLLPLLTIICQ